MVEPILEKGLEISSYGYCASKREKYYGMKALVIVDLNGNLIDYLLTKTNVDDKDAIYEIAETNGIDKLISDKGYVGTNWKWYRTLCTKKK